MKFVAYVKCKYLGIHAGDVVKVAPIEIETIQNKQPVRLRTMPIRRCDVCGDRFGLSRDLMGMSD